jgi:hypothetical protein
MYEQKYRISSPDIVFRQQHRKNCIYRILYSLLYIEGIPGKRRFSNASFMKTSYIFKNI